MAGRVTSQSITYFMHNHFLVTFDLVWSEHLAVINISPVSISLSELNKISLNGSNAWWCHLLKIHCQVLFAPNFNESLPLFMWVFIWLKCFGNTLQLKYASPHLKCKAWGVKLGQHKHAQGLLIYNWRNMVQQKQKNFSPCSLNFSKAWAAFLALFPLINTDETELVRDRYDSTSSL